MTIIGTYDPVLVMLSVAVAILASFTALNLAGRLLVAGREARRWWLAAAAAALGGGIWSMHFIGVLAFIMPMPTTYDIWLTLISLALPILVVGAGLLILNRYGNGIRPLLLAGLTAGLGIVVMHYGGMAAMTTTGVSLSYDPWLVAASVAIAVIAATAAFWLAFHTATLRQYSAAAVVMGFAIAGMHYTGMAAAEFVFDGHARPAPTHAQIQPGMLAAALAGAASIILLLGLATAFFDRKLATLSAQEADLLAKSEERLRALHRNASDIVAILDRDGVVTYEASSAKQILGHTTEEMTGKPLAHFVPAEESEEARAFVGRLLASADAAGTIELRMRHADGEWRQMELFGRNLLREEAIGGLVVNMRDISNRKRLMAELERLSETDLLTDTLNRRGFMKLATREFERAQRSGEPLSFVMIDIDRFKSINDGYGHAAGDMVLAMVSAGCRNHLRGTDLFGRFGGEEFLALLAGATLAEAEAIVARLQQAIREARVATIRGEVAVTASFGIATVDPSTLDLEAAIRLADEALYEAKNSGRNCIRIRA